MLEFEGLNVWAIVVTWLVYLIVGAFWYSPAGFAKQWARLTNVDIMKLPTKTANRILISVAVSSLVQAFGLAVVLNSIGVESVLQGVVTALLVWCVFVTATTVGVTLYQKRSWAFLWLNSAYFLVVMAIGSIILSVWK